MKHTNRFILLLCTLLCSSALLAAQVEVYLPDPLDGDLNQYCLDIVGGKLNANPEDGLQVHTCYSYQGELGIDQAMDPAMIEKGILNITGFDVCATLPDISVGATVALTGCNGGSEQQFVISENGHISPASATNLCLTAGKETTLGNNGRSRHQIKSLTLQECSADLTAYQSWQTRESLD